jgi:hypothetical protein
MPEHADTVRFSCPQCDWSYELPNKSYGLLEAAYTNHVGVRHFPNAQPDGTNGH